MFHFVSKVESSLTRQSNYLFVGKLSAFLIRFFVPIVLVRIFTKNDFGLYQLAMLIIFTLVNTLNMGLYASLYYYYPITRDAKDQLLTQTFFFFLSLGIILVLTYLSIFLIFDDDLMSFINNPITLPVLLIVVLLLISNMTEHIIILERKIYLNVIYLFSEQITRFAFVIIPAVYYRSIYHALWGLVCFAILRMMFFLYYTKNNYKGFLQIRSLAYMGKQVKYCLPLAGSQIVGEIGKKVDRYIVSIIAGVEKFGTYSIATINIPFVTLLLQSIFQVAVPALSSLNAVGDKKGALKLYHELVVKAGLVTIPSVIFFEIMADSVIRLLFTELYLDSVLPFRILLVLLILQMTGYGIISRAFNSTKIYFWSSLLSLCTGLIFGVVLTSMYGVVGGAIAAVVAFGVFVAAILYWEKRILGVGFLKLLPCRRLLDIGLISAVCGFVPFLCKNLFVFLGEFFCLIVSCCVYVFIICICFTWRRLIDFNIRNRLRRLVQEMI